jgi:hypothetical protein
MDIRALISDFQDTLIDLQHKLEIMRSLSGDTEAEIEVLMTRKEAAAFIGRSERQLDRLCSENKIHREYNDGEVRIRRSELLRFKGIITSRNAYGDTEMEELLRKYR